MPAQQRPQEMTVAPKACTGTLRHSQPQAGGSAERPPGQSLANFLSRLKWPEIRSWETNGEIALGRPICSSAGPLSRLRAFGLGLPPSLARFSFKQPLSQLADLRLQGQCPSSSHSSLLSWTPAWSPSWATLQPCYHLLSTRKCEVPRSEGLPWWLRGEEPACQCRRHGFNPWSGKISHAKEQLSPCAWALEPRNHNYCAHESELLKPSCPRAHTPQEKPPQWELHAPQLE